MIAVDWGTSSFRAYRLDSNGAVLEERSAAAGLLTCQGRFEATLAKRIEGWDDRLIVMAGMIGSRNGWREVPYVECPAGLAQIAAGLCEIQSPLLPGRRIFIAPGMSQHRADLTPEVMRGEETQVLGLIDDLPGTGPHTMCLPGTHSKWVQVEDGRIVALRTAMTGELYALLRKHSLLAALMPTMENDADDQRAFAQGMAASAGAGGLAHHLFGVRTLGLFDALQPASAPSYLSGLLIGHELRGLLLAGVPAVHLIGGAALQTRHAQALKLLRVDVIVHSEQVASRGLFRLATERELQP